MYPRIVQQLVRGIGPSKVTNLHKNHIDYTSHQSRDGSNGRIEFIQNGFDLFLNLSSLGIQFMDKTDGMLQFKGLSRPPRADKLFSSISAIFRLYRPLEPVSRSVFSLLQMSIGNLLVALEFFQQGIDRNHMKCGNQLFPLRKQNEDPSGDKTFLFDILFHLVSGFSFSLWYAVSV